ncbi:MAG: hypothetical protein IT307_00345 [Chloroflexi bacterium]|nr:hypothetical protein [Chloroflexota bacterium]
MGDPGAGGDTDQHDWLVAVSGRVAVSRMTASPPALIGTNADGATTLPTHITLASTWVKVAPAGEVVVPVAANTRP